MPATPSTGPLVEAGLSDRPLGLGQLLIIVARAGAVLGATLLLYALMPVDSDSTTVWIVSAACLGLLVVFGIFFRQFGRIERSDRPGAAAIESLVLVVGLFLTLFALIYVTLSASDPGTFTQPLDKVAGIYFSVTILSTVGYGDIAPTTDLTRILVTVQMLLDIALIGAAVKLLGMKAKNVQEARHRRHPREAALERDRSGHADGPAEHQPDTTRP